MQADVVCPSSDRVEGLAQFISQLPASAEILELRFLRLLLPLFFLETL